MKRYIFFISAILAFISCKKDNCYIYETYGNGEMKTYVCEKDLKSEFLYFENYNENGSINSSWYSKKGKLDGEKITYDPNGIIRKKFNYKKGLREGSCTAYAEDGKIHTLNYCRNDKTIFGKYYKYNGDSVSVSLNFDPLISVFNDTISRNDPIVKFEVDLQIPDSLIGQNFSVFKYGFKPMALKDSVLHLPKFEANIYYDRPYFGEIEIEEYKSQIFYGFIWDEELKNMYNHKQFVISVESE